MKIENVTQIKSVPQVKTDSKKVVDLLRVRTELRAGQRVLCW